MRGVRCCGEEMYWAGFTRADGRPTDIYRCGWCGAVKLVVEPRVAPRYLAMGGAT